MKKWTLIAAPALFLFSISWIYMMVQVHERDRAASGIDVVAKMHSVVKTLDKQFAEVESMQEQLKQQLQEVIDRNPKLGKVVERRSLLGTEDPAAPVRAAASERGNAETAALAAAVRHQPPVNARVKLIPPVAGGDVCRATGAAPSKTDIEMTHFLEKESFEDVDGGVWKQGYDLSYSMSDFDKQQLQVFVVPHSHNDPGWLKTVEGYFEAQTRNILNNVVNFLSDDSGRKFIWAEMSYLSMWWAEQGEEMKNKFRRLVRNGQLEIVTGGWVMNDEANTHYFAMVDQMIEGHEWIRHNVGEDIIPSSGWAIDPFGHSPTMAYILKRMNFDFMLIQRTHYYVKKQFARRKSLEFKWKQNWDSGDSTGMLTHMMPFYSYDVPHTCGPDPKICCQFDFRRLPGGKTTCPWRVNPVPISNDNVGERAEMLLDQYRKKSTLFRTNVLLIPLGDDFRYDLVLDAQNQFTNYEVLMKYINNQPRMKAKVQFGTLRDYYDAVVKSTGKDTGGLPKGYPAVSGDFYTYTDRSQDYWSGYFTSRPFYKNLDRVLESALRAAELVFSLSHALATQKSDKVVFDASASFARLVQARRTLGLFQHHDGITGTARMNVVVDYGIKLISAYQGVTGMMTSAVSAMLAAKAAVKVTLSTTSSRAAHDSLEAMTLVPMASSPRLVTVYNPLAKARTTIVRLLVDTASVEVLDADRKLVPIQLNPSWQTETDAAAGQYELLVKVTVLPLGVTSLLLQKSSTPATMSRTTLHHSSVKENSEKSIFPGDAQPFSIENPQYKLNFDANGMMKSVFSKVSQTSTDLQIGFHTYSSVVRPGHKPGAYLFFPDGAAQPYSAGTKPVVRITRGLLCTEVVARWPQIYHTVRIYNIEGLESFAIDVENLVDISQHNQKEFIMRMVTGVKTSDPVYYTDLNGFTMQRRQYHQKLSLQGNFYPLPAMAYLEDTKQRLSVASGQPLGSASLEPGWLEIVLDRRLMQDDDRGLGQPVTDNKPTKSFFRLVLEHKQEHPEVEATSTAYPTLMANLLTELFMHRTVTHATDSAYNNAHLPAPLAGTTSLPCHLFMVNLRTLHRSAGAEPHSERALLLHNKGYDCRYPIPEFCQDASSKVNLNTLFDGLSVSSASNVSLSLARSHGKLDASATIHVRPMEIETLKLDIQ